MPKVRITETVLGDAQQSLIAARMETSDMLPVLEKLDNVGYDSLEVWGGATFDASLRILSEDPWERLRILKNKIKNTKLQMLLRGQNLLGYKHYSDDVVEYFVSKSIANGIDIIRIYDGLNDIRNLETAIKTCKKEGAHVQGAICYTISPVHDTEIFVKYAKSLESIGADSICIRDTVGILKPYAAYELIKTLKESVNIPVGLHAHLTSGIASMTYLKAIEAGVDAVDCAISPFACANTMQPTESLVEALKDTQYDTGLDIGALKEVRDYFKDLKCKYLEDGLIDIQKLGFDLNTLSYNLPVGMISSIVAQLKKADAIDRYEDVLNEVQNVRGDFGYPPLETPISKIIGTQAILNVLTGEKYKRLSSETKSFIKGEYGRTPVPIKEEVSEKILVDDKPIIVRPADLLKPKLDKIRDKIESEIQQDEDILSYALFPMAAEKFFKDRREKELNAQGDNMEEIAAIAGAIAAIEAEGDSKIVVKSVRRIAQTSPVWSTVERIDRINTKL